MYKPEWKLRKTNTQYDIWDCRIAGSVVSITYLKPHQSTAGHQHPHSELYICLDGEGLLELGDGNDQPIFPGLSTNIPPDMFHKVHNDSDHSLIFLCSWKGENKT